MHGSPKLWRAVFMVITATTLYMCSGTKWILNLPILPSTLLSISSTSGYPHPNSPPRNQRILKLGPLVLHAHQTLWVLIDLFVIHQFLCWVLSKVFLPCQTPLLSSTARHTVQVPTSDCSIQLCHHQCPSPLKPSVIPILFLKILYPRKLVVLYLQLY